MKKIIKLADQKYNSIDKSKNIISLSPSRLKIHWKKVITIE